MTEYEYEILVDGNPNDRYGVPRGVYSDAADAIHHARRIAEQEALSSRTGSAHRPTSREVTIRVKALLDA